MSQQLKSVEELVAHHGRIVKFRMEPSGAWVYGRIALTGPEGVHGGRRPGQLVNNEIKRGERPTHTAFTAEDFAAGCQVMLVTDSEARGKKFSYDS